MKWLRNNLVGLLAVLLPIIACAALILAGQTAEDGSVTLNGDDAKYSTAQNQIYCELKTSVDNVLADSLGTEVVQDAGAGCVPEGTDIAQLGAIPYYWVDVSTPEKAYQNLIGKGFNEGYGLQCVAGFKEFMFALSGKYVATSTGGASGYAKQQSQIEPLGFTWHAGSAELKDGDWGIFTNGTYGHVAMYYNGKWFGQNQGAANPNTGNPFNLMSLGITPVGYYRPNIYANQSQSGPNNDSTPSSSPSGENDTQNNATTTPASYVVERGDTLGEIALKMNWWPSVQGLFGNTGYAQTLADQNHIPDRNLIYPNQLLNKAN
jgi:hypothetical protein